MAKKLFLISDSAAEFAFTSAAANTSGFEVVKTSNDAEAEALLANSPQSVVFLSKFRKTAPALVNQIHLFCDDAEQISQMQKDPATMGVGSFISRKWTQPEVAGETYALALKVFSEGAVAIKPSPENKTFSSLRLNNSLQKNWAASAVQFHLAGLGFRQQVCRGVVGATDELIMNAIFDAPHNADGSPRHQAPSDSEFELEGQDTVELEFFQPTENSFCMTVIDLHGTLKREDIRKHLANAAAVIAGSKPKAFNEERAGLGLASVFRSQASLIFRCVPGKRTEAIAWFHVSKKGTSAEEPFQFLSTFI